MPVLATLLDRARQFVALPSGNIAEAPTASVGIAEASDANLYSGPGARVSQAGFRGGYDWTASDRESVPELMGARRYHEFDRMVAGDPIVSGGLNAVTLPMVRTRWWFEEGRTPEDRAIRDFVAWNLGLDECHTDGPMLGTWPSYLSTLLLSLRYGSMTGFQVFSPEPSVWIDADGMPHVVRTLWDIEPRYPHVVDPLGYLPAEPGDRMRLRGMRQVGVERTLPGEQLVHVVHRPEFGRYTGQSLIRPAYTWAKIKRQVIVSAAIAFDRWSAGIPVVRYPNAGGEDAKREAGRIGRSVRTNERAYVTLPGPDPNRAGAAGMSNTDGWSLDILSGASAVMDPLPLLKYLDQQSLSSMLAHFLGLGSTETGARAVGEVLAGPFYLQVNAIMDGLAAEITDQVVRRIVEVNFGPDVDVPALRHDPVRYDDMEVLGRFMADAAGAGVRFDDREAQNTARVRAGFSELADDEPDRGEGMGDPLARAMDPLRIAGRQDGGTDLDES